MTSTHSVTITLDEQFETYSPEFQTEERYARSWQAVLKKAYRAAEVRCACRGAGEKRLAVKYLGGSDQFFLARFGRSAGQHSADCQYSSEEIGTEVEGGRAPGVVDVQVDGRVRVRLEIGLTIRDSAEPNAAGRESKGKPSTPGQAAIRLGGLLGYLWEASTLNQWKPYWQGRRNIHTVIRRLQEAATSVVAGDVALVEQLLLPAMRADDAEAHRNRQKVSAAVASKRRMLIIAPLAGYTEERADKMSAELKIRGFHGIPRVFFADGHWNRIAKRYQAAVAGWQAGHMTIAIAQVEVRERQGRESASLVDAALMNVTAQWIPVESSYERAIADKLVAEGRAFYKPLRYSADDDEVHPDFVLLDCDRGEVPMEVFGRTDEEYVARKREKCTYYDRHYGPGRWWQWDATQAGAREQIPAFPPVGKPG